MTSYTVDSYYNSLKSEFFDEMDSCCEKLLPHMKIPLPPPRSMADTYNDLEKEIGDFIAVNDQAEAAFISDSFLKKLNKATTLATLGDEFLSSLTSLAGSQKLSLDNSLSHISQAILTDFSDCQRVTSNPAA